ncbi:MULTISPECIES: DUF305 domain-containing protein [Curtobacterium]|jgi:uncharacterized protein (DUF305 family)|uniref:DUF305 domain-containing protein n=1 Tax=Curtobacterium TaxID=2034 RepID=UPI0009A1DB5A|nr:MULTISPECIES: DUF305 domain-containing protein [Curtobacterium]MCU0153739.1 DUF305 domain-containing protein [Curtobacterium flaccumfaciens pv. poinsettiae]MDT0234367.1 DUF305 domain-containing protein [Curtobacterium sp. BRB10]PCN49632.1 DUF305 domain-containing protein [Curtobacterium sp. 'Ferrero']RPE83232.1 uncharacterized protein (DUF305 family) [Curtobacterium sp. PhB137]TCL79048.1 uncharacterized protein (DUF305 family) [Curtobacterium sp. PhB128]
MNTTITRTLAATAALTIGLTLAGCSTNNAGSSDNSSSSSSSSSSTHNDQDVTFTQGMLPHHKQAIEMSDMLLAKGSDVDPDVVTLAKQIKAEQAPEIKTMTGWLKAWGEPTEMSSMSGMDHSSMSGGMMSDADMNALDSASPADAGKLFLQQMVEHHTSAVDMAKTEVDKGKNTDAVAMAKSIVSSQTEQISQMKDMLASM